MTDQPSHTLYCDEAGNTGANYSDPAQPVMVLAGWLVATEADSALRNTIRAAAGTRQRELHSKRMLRSSAGWSRIADLCALAASHSAVPFFYLVEKRYQLVERIVHALLDYATNPRATSVPRLGQPSYDALLDFLYGSVSDAALALFSRAVQRPNLDIVGESIAGIADSLAPKSPWLSDVIRGCLTNLDQVVSTDFQARIHHEHHELTSPHLPGFLHLLSAVDAYAESRGPARVAVIHDESAQYNRVWQTYFHALSGRQHQSPRTSRVLRPGFHHLTSLQPTVSASDVLVQLADLLASSLARLATCCLGDERWSLPMRRLGSQVLQPLLRNDLTYGGLSASRCLNRRLALELTSPAS